MVMGTYNGENIYYEPMHPLSFVTGTTDNLWEYEIVYENQVTENLAEFSSVSYSAETGRTTFTFTGSLPYAGESFKDYESPIIFIVGSRSSSTCMIGFPNLGWSRSFSNWSPWYGSRYDSIRFALGPTSKNIR